MTDYPDRRRLIGPALRKFFQDETGKKIGLARVPEGYEQKKGYGILYPLPGSNTLTAKTYDYNDPDCTLVYIFQMTLVGADHDQVAGMSDRVFKALLEKAPGGGYANSLGLPAGMEESYRGQDAFGGIVPPEDNTNLFQTADTYRIEVK